MIDIAPQSVRGYLPDGVWVPMWHCDGEHRRHTSHKAPEYAGVITGPGWHILPAPLGQPAVYYREGATSAKEVRRRLQEVGLLAAC